MNKKKIAVFFPSMADGGAERITLNLIRYIAKHYEYTIDLVLVNATGPFISQVPETVNIVDLAAKRTLSSVTGLIRYLRKNKPDVLLSGMDYVNVVALVAAKIAGTNTRTVILPAHQSDSTTGQPHIRMEEIDCTSDQAHTSMGRRNSSNFSRVRSRPGRSNWNRRFQHGGYI